MRISTAIAVCMVAGVCTVQADVIIEYTGPGGQELNGALQMTVGQVIPLELHVISDVVFDSTDVLIFESNDGAVEIANTVVAANSDNPFQRYGFFDPDYYASFTMFPRSGDQWLMSFDLVAVSTGGAKLGARNLNDQPAPGEHWSVIGYFGNVLPSERVPLPAHVHGLTLAVVPDPATLGLLTLGVLAIRRRRD